MKINIEKLTERELLDLNRRIVERLKFLALERSHTKMMQFSIGDKVSFQPTDREEKKGVLVKYNKKTVTVLTDDGESWNVAPQLLSKVEEESEKNHPGNVIELNAKRGA